jgi:hypothetical protein
MKRSTNVLLIVLSAFAIAVFLVGCSVDPEDKVDKAVTALDRAIDVTDGQTPSWQSVVEESVDELVKQGQSDIANEVSEAMERYFSDLNTPIQCSPVLLRDRLREDFVRTRAKLTEEELQLSPVFCPPRPNVVRFTEVQDGSVDSIEVSGYNLDFADIQVFLIDADNQQTDVSRFLAKPSQYLHTLHLGGDGVPLTSSSSELLFVLEQNNTRSVNVIQPAPSP